MPHMKAAKKALRASERRQIMHDRWRLRLHDLKRTFTKSLAAHRMDEARTTLVRVQSTLDRMARRHIIHKNTAARQKSRLAVVLHRGSQGAVRPP